MTDPSGDVVPVENLVAATSEQVKDLCLNIKRNAENNSNLPAFIDSHGQYHSSPGYLRILLRNLQSIESDGLTDLRHLNVSILKQLFDDIELEIADRLTRHVLKAALISRKFEEWAYICYEPTLRGVPNFYSSITKSASDLDQSLSRTYNNLSSKPRPASPRFSSNFPQICPGAIELINGRDHGRVESANRFDCSPKGAISARSRSNLESVGGHYKWWYCRSCDYRCEFHVRDVTDMSLSEANLILPSTRFPDLYFRETLWAKFHLRTVNVSDTYRDGPEVLGCVFCVADGEALRDNIFRRRGDLLRHIRNHHFYRMPPELIRDKLGVSAGETIPRTSPSTFDVHFRKS